MMREARGHVSWRTYRWIHFFAQRNRSISMLRKCALLVRFSACLAAVAGLSCWQLTSPLPAQDLLGSAAGTRDALAEPRLADGVLTVVPPAIDINEGVVYPRPFPGLAAGNYTPRQLATSETLQGRTQGITRYRDVWQLEFAFKELRYLEVKLPLPDGSTQAAGVWYLIYRVRNLDQHLSFPVDSASGEVTPTSDTPLAEIDPSALPGRFFPAFVLDGWVEDLTGDYVLRSYRDRVLPAAVPQIEAAEKMVGQLRDNIAMAKEDMAQRSAEQPVWGVATWLDVDPRVNFASVSVQGLSNAFRSDLSGETPQNEVKTLQINFWRPGDSNLATARFRLGIAYDDDDLNRQQQLVAKYRLPGPELVIDRIQPETGALTRLGIVPAGINLETMSSDTLNMLNNGQMPDELAQFLARFGVADADRLSVTATTPSLRWTVSAAEGQTWVVGLQAVTWQPNGEKIDFVGPLDYFWDFRYIR